MRTVDQLAVPKEGDLVEFPDSTVINEEPGIDGTPVVREIYGDVLTNIYAIVRDAGLIPNGLEDNTTNGHQFLQALKQFANEINDVERILTVAGTVITVDMDLTFLPNKYVIFARADDITNETTNYTLIGNTGALPSFNVDATSFNPGDRLMIILDSGLNAKIIRLAHTGTWRFTPQFNRVDISTSYSIDVNGQFEINATGGAIVLTGDVGTIYLGDVGGTDKVVFFSVPVEFDNQTIGDINAIQARSGANDPLPADIPAGHSIVWRNTTLGETRTWYNNGGVMESSAAFV